MRLFTRRRDDIVCEQAVSLMTAYLDGALSASDMRRLELHLAQCQDCARYLHQLRVTIDLTGRVDAGALDDETRDSLVTVYRKWRQP